MEDKDKTIKFLSNLLYDIQCDNEVVFCGEWSKKRYRTFKINWSCIRLFRIKEKGG